MAHYRGKQVTVIQAANDWMMIDSEDGTIVSKIVYPSAVLLTLEECRDLWAVNHLTTGTLWDIYQPERQGEYFRLKKRKVDFSE